MVESVTGRVTKRGNFWYAVISYKDSMGQSQQKWISTHLPIRGNKLRAENILKDEIETFKESLEEEIAAKEKEKKGIILFSDYLRNWVYSKQASLRENTYAEYERTIENIIAPFFDEDCLYIDEVTKHDIEEFYLYLKEARGVKPNTINRYHTLIHQALDKAVKEELIPKNVSELVDRDSVVIPSVEYYSLKQLKELIAITAGTEMEIFIIFGALYGLRRSETLGLRWKSIDFDNNLFLINHTVTTAKYRTGTVIIKNDVCKNKTSERALPLDPDVKEYLKVLKAEEEIQKVICGTSYNYEDDGYVCVDTLGNLYHPDTVSRRFKAVLRNNNLPHIKFHALRHSCASAMLAKGVSLKIVKEYLGHSDYRTTDRFYGHLEIDSKIKAMQAVSESINIHKKTAN